MPFLALLVLLDIMAFSLIVLFIPKNAIPNLYEILTAAFAVILTIVFMESLMKCEKTEGGETQPRKVGKKKSSWSKLLQLADLYLNSEHGGEPREGVFVVLYDSDKLVAGRIEKVNREVKLSDEEWKLSAPGELVLVRKKGNYYTADFLNGSGRVETTYLKTP